MALPDHPVPAPPAVDVQRIDAKGSPSDMLSLEYEKLLPFVIGGLAIQTQFTASTCLAGMMFFSIGALKSLVFAKPVLLSGLRTLLTGGTAAGLAYLTGHLLRTLFGIGA